MFLLVWMNSPCYLITVYKLELKIDVQRWHLNTYSYLLWVRILMENFLDICDSLW